MLGTIFSCLENSTSRYTTISDQEERSQAKREIENLKCTAYMRKTAIKTASFPCSPISLLCCCLSYCHGIGVTEDPSTDPAILTRDLAPYSNWTLCECEPCCSPKRLPKNDRELCALIFDPFACCVWNESEKYYLRPEERRKMENARKTLENLEKNSTDLSQNYSVIPINGHVKNSHVKDLR